MSRYNYYANLFINLKQSENITYKRVPTYTKADGTVMQDVLLVSSEVIGTKPIYKLDMQEKFFEEVIG